jgi:hypothetical protein
MVLVAVEIDPAKTNQLLINQSILFNHLSVHFSDDFQKQLCRWRLHLPKLVLLFISTSESSQITAGAPTRKNGSDPRQERLGHMWNDPESSRN